MLFTAQMLYYKNIIVLVQNTIIIQVYFRRHSFSFKVTVIYSNYLFSNTLVQEWTVPKLDLSHYYYSSSIS